MPYLSPKTVLQKTDLQFELSEDCIPSDFLKADVQTRRKRHLVFATEEQLHQLARASCLQSTRLSEAASRQSRSPSCSCLCLEKEEGLPCSPQGNTGSASVINFSPQSNERAVWTVFRELLPDVAFQGCLFHWTQALWRKVRIIYYQPSNKSTKRVKITNTKSIHTNGEKKTDKQTEKATLCD